MRSFGSPDSSSSRKSPVYISQVECNDRIISVKDE